MNRRGMLGAILGAGFAPAVIGSGILMPVSKKIVATPLWSISGLDPAGRIGASVLPSSALDSVNVRRLMILIKKEVEFAYHRKLCGDLDDYNFAAAVNKLIPENSGISVTHRFENAQMHTQVRSITHTGNIYVKVS